MALLDPAAPEGAATRKILARAWSAREAVCDRVIPVRVGGAQRWWSVTAKPVFAANGAFVGYRGVGSDVTAAKIADAAIERLARFDALTGLPNRAQLDEAMRADLQDELGPRMAVLSLDLDRFKSVNDTLGHQIGDQLLQSVAARLKNLCGQADLICRLGGDEFVVLLRGADRGQAARFATRAIEAVGERYDIEGYRVLVGASVGVAMAGEDGADPETLLRNSDLALYRAKTDGKGRFCFFEPEMDVAMQARRLLEIELRDALQRRAIEVHFQPVIDAASGLMTGCEALARWTHPVRGPIPPARFIPLAEETGLIVALGENVLLAACAEAAQWRGDLRVAVNLSAAQFKATDFVSYVRRTLAETGLRPDRLELEVTESVLIEDREAALAILSALRALGVRVSLDDFGTGYSSLSYLSSFPFDKIKIDRSFVRHVETRPDADAIIRAIVSIAGTLGMSTTAEGVETQIEFDRLRAHGCDEVQGFLFSAAVPPQELRRLIAEGRLEPLVAAA
jgi:diguanylate cyclase (GGDEF)-like protein